MESGRRTVLAQKSTLGLHFMEKAAIVLLVLLFTLNIYYNEKYNESFRRFSWSRAWERANPRIKHPFCNCTRESLLTVPLSSIPLEQRSTCGPMADIRGPHQFVMSYVFYGSTDDFRYFPGVEMNAKEILKVYPGWRMRLYHNIRDNQTELNKLCVVVCQYPNLDDCYVDDLIERLGVDLRTRFEMVWRFVVLGDPLVDAFCSRDLDSMILEREVAAVQEWMKSNKTWHTLRDHFMHRQPMMGGMWGVKNSDNVAEMVDFRRRILKLAVSGTYNMDQDLLEDIVFPEALNSLMSHDSYFCKETKSSLPFPTRRNGKTFVGAKMFYNYTYFQKCPRACRPAGHKDWLYC